MKPVELSKRLKAAASMVTAGNRVCDVGCDHGFVSIYLVEQGISPTVLAMDVRSGPLGAAKEHIAERGLETMIGTRLSDGLHNYNIGEADTLICAGMGGGLMRRILSGDRAKTDSFRELILQPQSEVEQLRAWLRESGYRIVEERMVEEDGKFYPMMRASVYSAPESRDEADRTNLSITCYENEMVELCKLKDRYGPLLLRQRDQTLAAYLSREERIYGEILAQLDSQGLWDDKRRDRYAEVAKLLEECHIAQKIVTAEETTRGEGECSYGCSKDQWSGEIL